MRGMRRASFIAILCATVVVSLRAKAAGDDDPRERAKREAWGWAVLIASVLERPDNNAFPGIRAWLADFRRLETAMPAADAGLPFPALDVDALISRNPRFWSACCEIAPGDPGFALLHASLLLCGGESQRASVIATLGMQRGATPVEFKRGLEVVIAGAQAAQAGSQTLVRDGVALHDSRLFDAALRKFDAAIAEWPANGRAYYERGSTLRLKSLVDASRARPVSTASGEEDYEPPGDPPGTLEAFAFARRHDPFCVMAYQGEDPAALVGMMALVRTALPIWETMRRRPEAPVTREELRDLSEACREAGIDEYALAARQQFVARNRQYKSEDSEFIAACAQRLAPGADVSGTLIRIGSDARLARHVAAPESPDEPVDPAIGGEAFVMAQLAAAEARLAKETKAAAAKEASAKGKARSKSKAKKRKR
jgi:hypothetical protein